jgi:hypothetical protein
MDAALVIGLVGVVLSSVALGWNIYRDVMDIGRLRVRCYFGGVAGGPADPGTYLVWSVTNIGRRAAIVLQIGGEHRGARAHFLMPRPMGNTLPRKLQSGDYGLFWTDDFASIGEPDDLKSLFVIDTLGKLFKASRKDLKRVKERLRQLTRGGGGSGS